MAKAAIAQLTCLMAAELAPRNILANTIALGFVKTPMSVKGNGEDELKTKWFEVFFGILKTFAGFISHHLLLS